MYVQNNTLVQITLASPMPLPHPNCYSWATLKGISAESNMIGGKGLGNWWYRQASLHPEGHFDLSAPRGSVHFLKTRDLSRLRRFATDLTTVLEQEVYCAQMGTSRPWHLVFFKWWEGFDLSGGPSAADNGEGCRMGLVGIRRQNVFWKFLCTIMCLGPLFLGKEADLEKKKKKTTNIGSCEKV